MTLGIDGPEFLPLRLFRDDDMLDAGSDPLIRPHRLPVEPARGRARRRATLPAVARAGLVPGPP